MQQKLRSMKTANNPIRIFFSLFAIAIISSSCNKQITKIESGKLQVEVNSLMQTLASSTEKGAKPLMGDFQNAEFLITKHNTIQNFKLSENQKTTFEYPLVYKDILYFLLKLSLYDLFQLRKIIFLVLSSTLHYETL